MKNQYVLYLLFCFLLCYTSQVSAEKTTKPVLNLPAQDLKERDVKFGIFITNLYDINFANNEFKTEFWAWFISHKKNYKPVERTEIVNSKAFSIRNATSEKIDTLYWHSQVFKGTIKQDWDISLFPFDTQKLTIAIEDTLETEDTHKFIADPSSSIANDVIPDGWTLLDFDLEVTNTAYPTTFGDPRVAPGSSYNFNRITAILTLKRDGMRLFASTFLGFFVATVLIVIVFSINMSTRSLPAIPLQPRITLCVGSLFAAVGSMYGLDKKLPYTTEFTLADSIQITTFSAIALAILSSVISDILVKNGHPKFVSKIMKSIFLFFVIIHFGINGYLLMKVSS